MEKESIKYKRVETDENCDACAETGHETRAEFRSIRRHNGRYGYVCGKCLKVINGIEEV